MVGLSNEDVERVVAYLRLREDIDRIKESLKILSERVEKIKKEMDELGVIKE